MIHPYHRILLNNLKKEQTIDTHNNFNKPHENYAEWKKNTQYQKDAYCIILFI